MQLPPVGQGKRSVDRRTPTQHVQTLSVAFLAFTIAQAQDTVTFKSGKKLECDDMQSWRRDEEYDKE
jgi:hypothetical protein